MNILAASAALLIFANLSVCLADPADDQLRAQKAIGLCLSRIGNPAYDPDKLGKLGDQLDELGATSLLPEDVTRAAKLTWPGSFLISEHTDLLGYFFSSPEDKQAIAWAALLKNQEERISRLIRQDFSQSEVNRIFFPDNAPSYVWLSKDQSVILSVDGLSIFGIRSCTFFGLSKPTAMVSLGVIANQMSQDNRPYADGLTYEVNGPSSYFAIRFLEFTRNFPQGERKPSTILEIKSNL